MSTRPDRTARRVPRALWAIALALALVAYLTPTASAYSAARPAAPTSIGQSRTALAFTWEPVSGAASYRVAYATNESFTGARYLETRTPAAELAGLGSARAYWVKVAVLSSDRVRLSAYSPAGVATTLPADGYAALAPMELRQTAASTTSLAFAWSARAGYQYRIRYATTATMAAASTQRTTTSTAAVAGLAPGTEYYVQIRVVDANGVPQSQYSPAIPARTTADALTLAAPTGLRTISRSATAVALGWNSLAGAAGYRVRYLLNGSVKTQRVSDAYAEVAGLTPGTSYSFKVRATDETGRALSPYSAGLTATTRPSTSFPSLSPTGLTVQASSPQSLSISWNARSGDAAYDVAYSTTEAMTNPGHLRVTTNAATVTPLDANRTYWLRVRVVSADGLAQSQYSASVSGRTPARSAPLRVGSYNVRCTGCVTQLDRNELPWAQRVSPLAEAVRNQSLDVLGVQEASQARLIATDGTLTKESQFEDLVQHLGSPYKAVNTARYNCESPSTSYKCVYKDQGASKGTKLIYNATTTAVKAQGSLLLSKIVGDTKDRYMVWARMTQLDSGTDFFVVNMHLESKGDVAGSTTYYSLRLAQAREALAEAARRNVNHDPVVLLGDLNSTKWSSPSNGPYDVAVAAGLVDPLGNTFRSRTPAATATVENRIRTEYSSMNHFDLIAPKAGVINGTYTDYIFTSPGIATREWETVVNIAPDDSFIGVIPSDHNMIRATLVLP